MQTTRFAKTLVAISAALSLAACGSGAVTNATSSSGATVAAQAAAGDTGTTASAADFTTHAQADDVDYNAAEASTITLKDGGQVCVRQADPLPLTLVSMVIEASVGG